MRFPLLFFVLVHLSLSSCPPFLEGLDATAIPLIRFNQAVDTACGRRNFTSDFWSPGWIQMLVAQIVSDEVENDNSTSISFRPLFESIKDQNKLMDKSDAKEFVDDLFKHYRNSSLHNLTKTELIEEIEDHPLYASLTLPVAAQIELAKATKNGFGMVETSEMKQQRIDTAMKTIERFGTLSHSERMAELFANAYLLVQEDAPLGRTLFEMVVGELGGLWEDTEAEDISYLEVAPALETLYLQYHALDNAEAKAFYLASMALVNPDERFKEGNDEDPLIANAMRDSRYTTCPVEKVQECYKMLSEEAKVALRTAFPELFEYLKGKISIDNWKYGSDEVTKQLRSKNANKFSEGFESV